MQQIFHKLLTTFIILCFF